ncbi:MAG: hypothetical protein Q8Q09_03860 [Deltaproteobacteria bacterium]|nr:hypothetical protein [Deltaproteobacteria bacterium]
MGVLVGCSPPSPNDTDANMSATDAQEPLADALATPEGGPIADAATADAGMSDPCPAAGCPVVSRLALSQGSTCALTVPGEMRCWGRNGSGQLGDGTMMDHLRPVVVRLADATQVSLGYEHGCARKSDGTVWCWGANNNGQLGNGTMNSSLSPVQVMGITTATKVAAGQYASCAILQDRSVRCWGRGTDLGAGGVGNSMVPVMVMNLSDATDLSMGYSATRGSNSQTACALRATGGVRCWGYGNDGQIGNGMRSSARIATDVMGVTSAREVHVGGSHVCVVLMDQTVQCWGDGISGQLGDGTEEIRTSPVTVLGVRGVRTLALGDRFSCAISMAGTAQCWGEGGRGQLGRGVVPPVGMSRSVMAAPVVGLTGIVAMGAGVDHGCAFTMDGLTRCWGDNATGQLGDGNATSLERFPTPQPVRW